MIAYKVCHVTGKVRCSVFVGSLSLAAQTAVCTYHYNKRTRPVKGNGPLVVCKTLAGARAFVMFMNQIWRPSAASQYVIYRAHIIPSKESRVWYTDDSAFQRSSSLHGMADAHDAILAKSVKLIRREKP